MKRAFSVFFIFSILATAAFSVELWNGFTTEMSKEEAIEHGRTLWGNNSFDKEVGPRSIISSYSSDYEILTISPSADFALYFITNSPSFPYVNLYFYEDNLFVVNVSWKSDAKTLLSRFVEQFGKTNDKKFKDVIFENRAVGIRYPYIQSVYIWNKTDRYIYLTTSTRDKVESITGSYFVDRIVCDSWQKELERRKLEERQAEEARRRAANEGIQF